MEEVIPINWTVQFTCISANRVKGTLMRIIRSRRDEPIHSCACNVVLSIRQMRGTKSLRVANVFGYNYYYTQIHVHCA